MVSVVLVVHLLQDSRHAGQILSLRQNMGQRPPGHMCGCGRSYKERRGAVHGDDGAVDPAEEPLHNQLHVEPGGTLKESQLSITSDVAKPAASAASHHVPAVQDVQDGAEQLDAGLLVRFDGVVVQLAAQLVGDQRKKNLPAVCGAEAGCQGGPAIAGPAGGGASHLAA